MLYGWELLTRREEDLIARGVMEGAVYGGPFHLALFPTNRCNQDCFFCYTAQSRRSGAELDWPTLRRALEEGVAMGVKSVSLGGGGESFLYSHFADLLAFLEERALRVDSVKTNGTALSEEVARTLIRLKLRRITISLNETTAPKHRAMSRGPERLFQQAVDGIAAIVAAKREARADAEISVQAFIWKENFRRIEEMTAFLADTGADLIYLSAIDLLPAELRMTPEERDELRSLFPGLMRKWADRIRTNFDAEGLTESVREEQAKVCPSAVTLPDLCPTAERIEFCNMPWYAPVIDATGNVFPCCHLTTDPSKSLGDLHAESLKDIWQGRKARALRAEMRHLLLTHANRRLLPRRPRFIVSLCLERAACAFNFYLCSPRFYTRIHEWAESGPRRRYTARRRLLAGARGVLRTAKRTAKRLLKAG